MMAACAKAANPRRSLILRCAGLVLPALALAWAGTAAAQRSICVPAGSVLSVKLDRHIPMRVGQTFAGRLLYPVYVQSRLAIPAGVAVLGHVTALKPARTRRIRSRLGGDFTPFHIPAVTFDALILPDGAIEPIATNAAMGGAEVLHLSVAPAPASRSWVRRQLDRIAGSARESVNSAISAVTSPGLGDRLLQLLYGQLPYHPERIAAGTTWTATLKMPLELPEIRQSTARTGSNAAPVHPLGGGSATPPGKKFNSGKPEVWHIHAYLKQTIGSAIDRRGERLQAVVASPVFDSSHNLTIPQGSMLMGTVTEAKPARWFGRAGKLRFDFRELKLPGTKGSGHILGTLAGVDSDRSQQLAIDDEGGISPKPRNRIVAPLVLTVLAGRTLSDDGSVAGNAAVGSNGFGLIGRIVGMTAGSRALAAGIGFYSAGLSFAERWIAPGGNVTFPANTRINVTTAPVPAALPVVDPRPVASNKKP
jgi:hypothetical protein